MQLVYEFGAKEVAPVVEAIKRALGSTSYSVSCRPNDSDTYSQTEDSLASAVSQLKKGDLASVTVNPKGGLIRYALIMCPFSDGQQRSMYLGTIEYLGEDYKGLWNLILSVPGLSMACLGFEEGVELEDTALSADTFPWNQWPLVIGALRDESGSQQWAIHQGPEMRWFAKATPSFSAEL